MSLVVESLEQLYEAGELGLVPPYSFKRDTVSKYVVLYLFTTEDGDRYAVRFFNLGSIKDTGKNEYQMEFVTSNPKDGEKEIVNKRRVFKVMSTIVHITMEFVSYFDPDIIRISPSKNYLGDHRRNHLYKRYINAFLPITHILKTSMFSDDLTIKKV